MTDPHPWRMLLNGHKLPPREADFFRRLRSLEDQVRRLPQSLCLLLTHTPLTQDGCRYSLFECEENQRLGPHWRMEGEYYEWEHLPNFVRGTDRFPFGVVLSQRSSLFDLAVDSKKCTWLNFGGKGGFYVAGNAVRASPPDGKVTYEKSEMTIWHYFATDTGEPTPDQSQFARVDRQLSQCYRGIRETLSIFEGELSIDGDKELIEIIGELDWPEVMLYLGLKHPEPLFGVEHGEILRSFQGVELVPWGNPDECHHVFMMRPPSVAGATSLALATLCRMANFNGKPMKDALSATETAATMPLGKSANGASALLDGGASTPVNSDGNSGKAVDKSDSTSVPEEFVQSDYVEPMFKSELADLFEVSRVTIARRIKSGELRVMPGTSDTAKKVRVHQDDFPVELKQTHARKTKLSNRPKKGK